MSPGPTCLVIGAGAGGADISRQTVRRPLTSIERSCVLESIRDEWSKRDHRRQYDCSPFRDLEFPLGFLSRCVLKLKIDI